MRKLLNRMQVLLWIMPCLAQSTCLFFSVHYHEVISTQNPLGVKSGGESGTTPAPAVIINAVVDALYDLGVKDIEMPATPNRVWLAINKASESKTNKADLDG